MIYVIKKKVILALKYLTPVYNRIWILINLVRRTWFTYVIFTETE